ncbi:hypothetical protein LTR08_004669 [Meristemomyces frigidus]|nr:hypothetical protein LTR08_004669 [Meristemomyces frigidus]
MHATAPPSLPFDEVDDLLYFARANEAQDLQQSITELAQKYQCEPRHVLEACVDPETGNTVWHYCSANGFAELLRRLLALLQNGAEDGKTVGSLLLNARNRQGNTALHWAAYNGHLEVVKLLLAAGADMWVKNAAGHLAMFEAERADKSGVVQFLLEAGGREVERTGTEGQASAEDEVDVPDGEASGAEGAVVEGGSGDVNMDDA